MNLLYVSQRAHSVCMRRARCDRKLSRNAPTLAALVLGSEARESCDYSASMDRVQVPLMRCFVGRDFTAVPQPPATVRADWLIACSGRAMCVSFLVDNSQKSAQTYRTARRDSCLRCRVTFEDAEQKKPPEAEASGGSYLISSCVGTCQGPRAHHSGIDLKEIRR